MDAPAGFFDTNSPDWEKRLATTESVMRELSLYTDPQAMNEVYTRRMVDLMPVERVISLSRRDLPAGSVRVTRFNLWQDSVNPWEEPHRLPVLHGGIFARLMADDKPCLIDDLEVAHDDPAFPYLKGQKSLLAIPHYDNGKALNMVVVTREAARAFDHDRFPELVWMSNLFGRATQASRLSAKLQKAFDVADHEMAMVARMQKALLPAVLPEIPTLDLAVHYQMLHRAGGDYYDFFELPKGRWGILIADVSGHGTSAAVLMSIVHSLAKTYTGPPHPPGLLLSYINHHLATHYTQAFGTFVTAMYAIYDPAKGTLTFSNAGHNPARLVRSSDGTRRSLGGKRRLPLGINATEEYPEVCVQLVPGDQVVFYTDGITEAANKQGEFFGSERLDAALADCPVGAGSMLEKILSSLEWFTGGEQARDDRTVIAMKFGAPAVAPEPKRDARPAVRSVSESGIMPVAGWAVG